MSSRRELLESFSRILWLEKEMRDLYSSYNNMLSDEELKDLIKIIALDESRHINMAENILAVLQGGSK